MANILRVRDSSLPISKNQILGEGIDVMALPEGHMSCATCKGYKFECWVYMDQHRLEMGCMKCNESYRLVFPYDVSLSPFGRMGRFYCKRHPTKGMILIHNVDTLCIGCELCVSEVRIFLKSNSNIVLAN